MTEENKSEVNVKRRFEWLRRLYENNRIQLILFVLAFLFFVVYMSPNIFIVVKSGESGVLWRRFAGGTVIDQPPTEEGLQYIFPWDKLTIYNVRVQEEHYKMQVLTRNALPIQLDVSVRYHPEKEMLPILHKNVGPDYLKTVVLPEVENVLRAAIGEWEAEQLYANSTALHGVISEAVEQIGQRYIKVDDVLIRKITFPPAIAAAIEHKLKEQQAALAYKYKIEQAKQEAERKKIEAEGYAAYNNIIQKTLEHEMLLWKGIEATREIAQSQNAKVVLIGNSAKEMPIILGEGFASAGAAPKAPLAVDAVPVPPGKVPGVADPAAQPAGAQPAVPAAEDATKSPIPQKDK